MTNFIFNIAKIHFESALGGEKSSIYNSPLKKGE